MKKYIILLLAIITITSCTENSRAKGWGGTAEVVLPKGKKLVTATWKETSLWYLTKDMTEDDVAETYEFHEESSLGVMEGTYRIIEVKQ